MDSRKIGKKGQAMATNAILTGMLLVVIIGFLGIISVTVYNSIETSLSGSLSSSTQAAAQTFNNFTDNVWDSYDLASNVPIILAAGLLISVIAGFWIMLR